MVRDPICGQRVDPSKALRSEYEPASDYFCSADCKAEFDDDPERYVGWSGTPLSGSA